MDISPKGDVTKQRILECAAKLFAEKGFTETTIREITKASSLKNPASLYFHFSSKYAILEHMLEEYTRNTDYVSDKNVPKMLNENSTLEGILACYQTAFPADKIDYYLNVLCMLLQEQLRDPYVKKFVSDKVILHLERNTKTVLTPLLELGAIRQDTDMDYWMKAISCLLYTFAARRMLGIGDNKPEYTGKGMGEMLEATMRLMLELCGTTPE